ncbi:MAG: response regulator [Anaerolineaceae bacterium]|nr:response regulator [Anaerolineaceae bacterium]
MNKLARILLAEDDPLSVELTLEVLGEYNLANDVAVVDDGEQALDYLYRRGKYANRMKGNPAVILLDIKMPKIDGLEVLRQVKRNPDLKAIPIVILTSSTMESDLVESYNLGANAFVVKPVAFPDFVEAIKTLGVFWALINKPPARSVTKKQ